MKMKLLFLCLLVSYIAIGQIDSIESEILNYRNSKPEIISKGRRLMIDKLLQNDFQKMKEIKDYLLKNIDDKEYHSFGNNEYWLILYWTQEFDELLTNIEKTSIQIIGNPTENTSNYIVPVTDQLYETLVERSNQSKTLLHVLIENSNLNPEEIDFLKLHLDYCLFNQPNSKITQDSLNIQSDKFIIKYPLSVYKPYIKKVIQYKEKVSDFGFAYDFFIGYGSFTGSMAKHINNYAPFGFSMDVSYRNFVLNMGFGTGFTKLKQSIVYQNITWDREFSTNLFFPQATLGFTFFDKERINFNPYFGIYTLMVTPSYEEIQYNPSLENIYIQSDASFIAGFSLNLYSKPAPSTSSYRKSFQFQGFVKLKYTYYQSGFRTGFSDFDGDMHTICLTFGGIMKRVHKL